MGDVRSANLGFPRIGPRRELKWALEDYWSGRSSASELEEVAAGVRRANWQLQHRLGIDHVPCNDFSLYDHVLDTAVMVGAVPERYLGPAGEHSLSSYFTMARGGGLEGAPIAALEMTKWFDSNYHYAVPELVRGQRFRVDATKVLGELSEARALGIPARPVLLGPVSFLVLAKQRDGGSKLEHSGALTRAYGEVLAALAGAGAGWVQIDEPALGLDLPNEVLDGYQVVYRHLAEAATGLHILVATYFSGLRRNLPVALRLPVAALHLDVVRGPEDLDAALSGAPETLSLSLGVVDGRNVWRANLAAALGRLEKAKAKLGPDRLIVAPSCSLLHLPLDIGQEEGLDPEVRAWLAFAVQRLEEVVLLTRALNEGPSSVADELAASAAVWQARVGSPKTHDPAVRGRLAELLKTGPSSQARSARHLRRVAQRRRLGLPVLPTTTIGSFPQTKELRLARARHRRGELTDEAYARALRAYIASAVKFQEDVGLDVIVHGEPERSDMVEYFAERLTGFAVTANGWVQSYGSRCVKPPVLYGDVSRPAPFTVEWARYAQSLTGHPVKGILTGPVTMLKWSFVRDDQPESETCYQLALSVRDELADLEAAGVAIVQVDEPALREGLPLHREDRPAYLAWAVGAFRVATSGARDDTQVHTHMCYAEFDDIMPSIIALDADVISFEAARSGFEVVESFARSGYPNDVGPGIWDVHSPRTPTEEELAALLERLVAAVPIERAWANPDCGLKTRSWDEVGPALRNLVAAAHRVRSRHQRGS